MPLDWAWCESYKELIINDKYTSFVSLLFFIELLIQRNSEFLRL